MPQFLSPIGNDQFIDANGDPLTGGQIETYLNGSSTPAATYTSSTGGTAQSNPIILNSLGYAPSPVWITGGIAYKFVIKNASGSTLRTIDDISGINDASVSQSEWVESGFVPTYINATSFSVPGDQTPTLQIGRRLRTTNTSGLVYSTISNSVFAAGITTVTLTNDSTTLDAGLTLVAYALLAASPVSVPNLPFTKITGTVPVLQGGTGQTTVAGIQSILPVQQVRVDVASAATVNLTTSVPSNDHINITGTTTITAFAVAAGRLAYVRFNAALTLTNNANIVTQTGANITTAAGDTCVLRATAANVVEVLFYEPATPRGIGFGQTWQNVTGSRATSTTYTNSTGRPIEVKVIYTGGGVYEATFEVDSLQVQYETRPAGAWVTVGAIVPNGSTYRATSTGTYNAWRELR